MKTRGKARKARKAESPPAQAEPVELPPPECKFEDAVALGKELVADLQFHQKHIQSCEWRLGELSDRLEPRYGDRTLARFAEEIGLPLDTVNRCRSVYRAYPAEIRGTSPTFGVAQALQAHPDRVSILKAEPDITVREARTKARAHRATKDPDWRVNETRRWFCQAVNHARDAIKYGHPAQDDLNPDILRDALDEPDRAVATLRAGGRALTALADEVEDALANKLIDRRMNL